jgi:NAD(P)-dependent dehydrogenase (short-subunit alcohol dehydrogenase family)
VTRTYDGTVVVTGGSSGIGLGTARVFCEAGATVVICARSRELGEQRAAELNETGPGSCHFRLCDLADIDQVRALIEDVVSEFARLDCLVNNAAQPQHFRRIDEIPVEEFRALVGINIVSVFAACKFALPHLRQTRGSIVNVGSITGKIGAWHAPGYATSKGAISSLTRALAIDEAESGVRVNVVLPGHIMVERRKLMEESLARGPELHDAIERETWIGRSGAPEEVGRAILFLASKDASYITGAELIVGGGVELGSGPKMAYPDFTDVTGV